MTQLAFDFGDTPKSTQSARHALATFDADVTNKTVLLNGLLAVAVYNEIATLRRWGGLTERDIAAAQAYGEELAAHGDDLLYGSKKKGETAKLFAGLAHALAVLAFCQGGVRFLGETYQAEMEPEGE